MAMQVSWIDAERIKALVAQIAPQEACVEETPGLVEIDTTPETLPGNAAEAWGFAMDWLEPSVSPAPAAALTEAFSDESELPAEMEDEADDDAHGQSLPNAAAALPLSRIRGKLRAIRQRATDAGILTRMSEVALLEPASQEKISVSAPVAEETGDAAEADACKDEAAADMEPEFSAVPPQTPVFEVPQGSREVRLAAFAGWARQVLHEDGGQVLVMSDDGEVLWGGEAKAGLVLSTMMAWGAAIRASAMSACETPPVIHQPLASGHVLTVIPCETVAGMVHAAVAAPAGLSHELAHILRGALCSVMN
ncbi:MAG: hypothetical protein K9N47_11120 [Prosthecobacter sp.]|uniref:hypothetical protein n=1 Tax=Prosthecobacter sp. TaxID=1965333 RepID=UPI0025D97C9A|nr:hypothetical protein [Prosthecobacter sp.]MCF7786664.1 hypothetical protein [Prosthecobacter sp.]